MRKPARRASIVFTSTLLATSTLVGCGSEAPPRTAEAATVVVGDKPPVPTPAPAPQATAAPSGLPPGHPPTGAVERRPPPGPVDPNAPLPPGHPPVPPAGAPATAPGLMPGPQVARETDQTLPLVLEGAGGRDELTRRKAMLPAELQAPFEEAFRLVFTLDRAKRDATRAGAVVATLVVSEDKAARAAGHRLAGYLAINRGFDAPAAIAAYQQAISVDPDYGEAHYALAFTLAISDLEAARGHFERAMALGVPDTRQLRTQFFGGATAP